MRLLLADGNYLPLSFGFVLIPTIGYTLLYIFLTIADGAPSSFTPWLNIPKDIYYSVNRFLLAPGMFLAWISAAGVIQLRGHLRGGSGSFEQILATTGLAIGVAMWGALLHDLPMSFLSAVGAIDARAHEVAMNSATIWRTLLWTFYALYGLAFFVLFTVAVRVAKQLSWRMSFVIGSLGFIVFQLVFLIFNR